MKLRCNAKLNLCLAVTGKREDGYHFLDSVMQSISLYDTLSVEKANEIIVKCSKSEFDGEKNIAYSAAKAFFDFTGVSGGADIYIEKGIPDAGGLGGGSSDAAGVIIALNEIYNTGLELNSLLEIGLKVGADVPFCIFGGTARVKGIGEMLERLDGVKKLYFVVAKNGTKPSTAEMYKQLDEIKNPIIPNTELFAKKLVSGDMLGAAGIMGNSFQSVTGLFGIDQILKNTNALKICLSGSGPCVFAMYENEAMADTALKMLKSKKIEAYKAVSKQIGVEIM